jgi:hypothetical protein
MLSKNLNSILSVNLELLIYLLINMNIPEAIPVNSSFIVKSNNNGLLMIGSRISTCYRIDDGGDGNFYRGTITNVYDNNICSIIYDDGYSWSGDGNLVQLLNNPNNHNNPNNPNNPNMSIIGIPIHQYDLHPNIVDNHQSYNMFNCKDCNNMFTRHENNKGSSSYFRCEICQKKMLTKCFYSCSIC